VKQAPVFWVPKVLPLVGSANRTEHNNAVSCLVQFELKDLDEEVTHALLPWLSNPDWAVSVDRFGRIGVVHSLAHFVMPESVPGLIAVLEKRGDYDVASAARALANQATKESIPALKKALAKQPEEYDRRNVIEALLKLKGFTDEEKADGVVAYAVQVSTEEGREALSQASLGPLLIDKTKAALSPQVSIHKPHTRAGRCIGAATAEADESNSKESACFGSEDS
jgi:PBS lyase HEAT-like repeat